MSLAHCQVADTGEVKQGLACFCSTTFCFFGSTRPCWGSCTERERGSNWNELR